jgi:cytochrome P450
MSRTLIDRADSHGPKLTGALPLIGHLALMRRDPLATLVAASRIGNVSRIDLGPRGEAYVVTHPDGVKRVLLENQPNYSKRTRGFDSLRLFLGQGLLTSEGDFWRKQRRIAQPAFHHRNLQAFGTIMQQAGESLADRWEAKATKGEPFDVAREMMQVTLSIVGRCLFSTDPDAQSSAIGRHLDVMLERFIRRVTAPMVLPLSWPTAGNRRIRLAIDELHRIVDEIVAQRRIAPGSADRPTDLLDLLMAAEDAETGTRMSDRQLRDEVLTLLLAGHETTAATLGWTWSLLARHPDIDRRLGEQLAALDDGPIDAEALGRAPLVSRVVHEAMRLYPPAWIIARRAEGPDRILGVSIPRDHLVIITPYATHRRPDLFRDPERFDPDRFDGANGPSATFDRFAYFPFGGGPRICIGNGFALMEAQILLATLRRRFRLQVARGAVVEPMPLLTLRARRGIEVVAHAAR